MAYYSFDDFPVNTIMNGTTYNGGAYVSAGDHYGFGGTPSGTYLSYITDYTLPAGTVKYARLYVGIYCCGNGRGR